MAVSCRKVKLVCSYGGQIQAAPIGDKLLYSGGDNKLLVVDRNVKFHELLGRLSSIFRVGDGDGGRVGLKYQLPGEDLNLLVSLTNDDDLENMMFEYDRLHRNFSAVKTVRIRLFLNVEKQKPPNKTDFGSGSASGSSLNPDYLFGFDKEVDYSNVRDDHALEQWKIPRDQKKVAKPECDDQRHVTAQPQNRDGHVTCAGAEPSMFYYPPANGWGAAPAYIIVPSPAAATAVPRYCVL